MYCTFCGKQIGDGALFCQYCGKPTPQGSELAELVVAARIGDKDAISALYEKTYSRVYYTVKAMIKDEDAVFDIVQDTYIKAFAHLNSFQGDTKFLPWMAGQRLNRARQRRPAVIRFLPTGIASCSLALWAPTIMTRSLRCRDSLTPTTPSIPKA